jgi:LCP family protein required for cell wall assembly
MYVPGGTIEPGITPLPGGTIEPGITPLPGGTIEPGITPLPVRTLEPGITPPPDSTRVTILLTGVDSAPGRPSDEQLNDTLLVVSIDTQAKTAAMVSVPRDTAGFPLYWGGSLSPTVKINALATYVRNGWIKSPDEPMTTLTKEIGFLIGIPINYYALLDLFGFVHLIDMVGGVDIVNPSAIHDSLYYWLDGSPNGFQLSAGPHHLDGRLALAYVRSRRGTGNNVYARASRQEEVLVSLAKRLATPEAMSQLPSLLQTASQTIRTNFPADQVADMVALGQELPKDAISQYVLGPPYSLENAAPTSGKWTSCLRLDKVAQLSVQLFGQDSRYDGKTQPATCAS